MSKSIIEENFGIDVFSYKEMKKRISDEVYTKLMNVIDSGEELTRDLAEAVAEAMKNWAIEKGATHYTHWFQPLTGFTAEKHDSFLGFDEKGDLIMEFSGKQLIKGEADASSFPSGGARATFEARGYTVWDCTSPAFIKKNYNGSYILCIPTAFCSYTGDALDKKTPLLRSMEALNKEAIRTLHLMGRTDVKKVLPNLGAEQEYFLIDKQDYKRRYDLIFTGRTLFGATSPKGQEKEDQYYASIRDRVSQFMADLNLELWKLGIPSKTQHNEAAPAQHELAPLFCTANIATDQNQLIMETMKKVAERNDLCCLLHEKPFEGVNGSGKHNNWSLSTGSGENLLKPGKDPESNIIFLLFFISVIAGVDEYPELIRMSAAHAGNDHRLGANEAPPAIVSVFTDNMLLEVLEDIERQNLKIAPSKQKLKIGVSTLPALSRDFADRNRTSPFAFTGNKFEFRMIGSSASTATPNVILNTATAEILSQIADRLEKVPESKRVEEAYEIVRTLFKEHKKVIFNGNNYSKEWREEAQKRGLPNINNSVDAIRVMTEKKSVELFEKHKVYTERELRSRQEIHYEDYSKTINIEALTMLQMARQQILPSVVEYKNVLAETFYYLKEMSFKAEAERNLLKKLDDGLSLLYEKIENLDRAVSEVDKESTHRMQAESYRDKVLPAMNELRRIADELEKITAKKYWNMPTYADLLFYN